MIIGNRASLCGYGEVCAFALRGSGVRILVAEMWPLRSPSWIVETKTSVE